MNKQPKCQWNQYQQISCGGERERGDGRREKLFENVWISITWNILQMQLTALWKLSKIMEWTLEQTAEPYILTEISYLLTVANGFQEAFPSAEQNGFIIEMANVRIFNSLDSNINRRGTVDNVKVQGVKFRCVEEWGEQREKKAKLCEILFRNPTRWYRVHAQLWTSDLSYCSRSANPSVCDRNPLWQTEIMQKSIVLVCLSLFRNGVALLI